MSMFNRKKNGGNFDQTTIQHVWQKGIHIPGYSPSEYRKDMCGFAMKFADYGNTGSQYGWEVDHMIPVNKNGSDHLDNLQPLQWQHNRRKADTHPWTCEA